MLSKDFKTKVFTTLDSYKNEGHIAIFNNGEFAGILWAVSYTYEKRDIKYIDYICKWREENPEGFANSFRGTPEKTKYWLDYVLLPRGDRILFMVYPPDGVEPIGHLGLSSFNFEEKSCEIDNVVRGVKGEYSGFMSLAVRALTDWAKDDIGVEHIYLRVLADNPHAIRFYERLGFREVGRIPLYKTEKPDFISWDERPGETREPDRYFIKMKLT